jgi:hypothetical protein
VASLRRLRDDVSGYPFYCLEETVPVADSPGVLLLPGVGENRSGHNYIFVELSRSLARDGFTCFRLDLAGLGDSLLPLDIAIWRRQFTLVTQLAAGHRPLHVVARGAAALAVPSDFVAGTVVLLRPPSIADFEGAETLASTSQCGLIKPRQGGLSAMEERLLTALGVETRVVGGLVLTNSFLEEAAQITARLPAHWIRLFASEDRDETPLGTHLSDVHTPLFLRASDREAVLRAVSDLLQASFA